MSTRACSQSSQPFASLYRDEHAVRSMKRSLPKPFRAFLCANFASCSANVALAIHALFNDGNLHLSLVDKLLFRAISRSIRATAFQASRSSFLNERRSAAGLAYLVNEVRVRLWQSVRVLERMLAFEPDAQGCAHVAHFIGNICCAVNCVAVDSSRFGLHLSVSCTLRSAASSIRPLRCSGRAWTISPIVPVQ